MKPVTTPKNSEELPPIVVADRRAPRRKALLGAVAFSRDGRHRVDCAIKEISPSGAKIVVPKGQVIPERCYLVIPARDVVHDAVVARVTAKEIGLKFLASYEPDELTQPGMEVLRRLMIERLPRAGNELMGDDRRRRGRTSDSAPRKP